LKPVDSTPRWRLRLLPRIWRHHLPLLIISSFCVAVLYQTRPYPDIVSRASFATAYPALALLTITLLIGPWNLLAHKPNPVSSDLRRDIGIWAGLLGILHAGVGQFVHLRGRPWLYYVYGPTEHHHGMRHDLFGLANYTGALGTLLLIVLLATSNDFSLRKFGKKTWKQLQRWNYAVFALIAVHSFAFQGVETQKLQWVLTASTCVLAALALQISGFIRHAAD
jgi:methionine sulfoxide reductase heme-binding subunit